MEYVCAICGDIPDEDACEHKGNHSYPMPDQEGPEMEAAKLGFLRGGYAALGWVLTSPRITGDLRERIYARAMEMRDEMGAMGVEFTDAR